MILIKLYWNRKTTSKRPPFSCGNAFFTKNTEWQS